MLLLLYQVNPVRIEEASWINDADSMSVCTGELPSEGSILRLRGLSSRVNLGLRRPHVFLGPPILLARF